MNLIKQLEWRYATKRMNGQAVPQEKVDKIWEAIHLAPSSFGLTPYKVLVVKDAELRKKVQAAVYMQPQIVEGSHLLVFAVWDDITEKQVDDFIALVAKTRNLAIPSLSGYKDAIWGSVKPRSVADRVTWAAKQAYIALGVGLAAAASESVDATPMEGFDPAKLDEILNLKEKGLKSVVLMMLGYRLEDGDPLVHAKKVRRPKEELFINM